MCVYGAQEGGEESNEGKGEVECKCNQKYMTCCFQTMHNFNLHIETALSEHLVP